MANLLITRDGNVATITMNRPDRHNAFDDVLIGELTRAFAGLGTEAGVRAIVLEGNGPSFSAGADLGWMKRMADYSEDENFADAMALAKLMEAIDANPKPVIGVVDGAAYGGGVGLVACCDMVVASPKASFCLSEVKLGLIPAVISPYVARAIGGRNCRRYFLTAERFSAEQAKVMGLVHEVAEPDQLARVRDEWLDVLGKGSPAAQNEAKMLVRAVTEAPLDQEMMEHTAGRIAAIRASTEGREGVRAFLEKRKADWVVPRVGE